MSGETRGQPESEAELQVQLHLLQKACQEFDAGDLHEFRNIARALRVILTADNHGDISLLARAGHGSLAIPDTRNVSHPLNLAPEIALVALYLGGSGAGITALLDDANLKKRSSLSDWLEQPIADDREGNRFTRHRLVKATANLAGGTHFPSDVRGYYAAIEKIAVNVRVRGREAEIPYRDVEKHSLRQIAFELLHAFERTDGRGARVAPGTLLIAGMEMLAYPGRRVFVNMSQQTKKVTAPFLNRPPVNVESIAGPIVKLPYADTTRNAPCPCMSGLKFKQCCSEARDFSAEFVNTFEMTHKLGKHREQD